MKCTRLTSAAACLLLAAATCASAQEAPPDTPVVAESQQQGLATVVSLNMPEMPLAEAVRIVAREAGLKF